MRFIEKQVSHLSPRPRPIPKPKPKPKPNPNPDQVNGKTREPGQVNNFFIFPGMSFGAISCKAQTLNLTPPLNLTLTLNLTDKPDPYPEPEPEPEP